MAAVRRAHSRAGPATDHLHSVREETTRRDVLQVALAALAISLSSFGSAAQSARTPENALVAALVWGEYDGIDLGKYPPHVKAELERAYQRFEAYQSLRPKPVNASEEEMVYAAMVRYERLLVAFAADSKAQALAVEYVDTLRPCYEWEGYHDCPEREASYATEYLTANPGGSFTEFLLLLAGHRWLCTAEAYEYEKRPEDAARSRRASAAAIQTARRSAALVIRRAAEALEAHGRCHFPG